MGTNFYWYDPEKDNTYGDDPAAHIGKRSAAGSYCWDCGITLCKHGEAGIHYHEGGDAFHKTCPRCGASKEVEKIDEGSVGVELGFAKPNPVRPKGVTSCASFTWAQHPDDVCQRIIEGASVVDEYGRIMPGEEFLIMLETNCPVRFHCIGSWFS